MKKRMSKEQYKIWLASKIRELESLIKKSEEELETTTIKVGNYRMMLDMFKDEEAAL